MTGKQRVFKARRHIVATQGRISLVTEGVSGHYILPFYRKLMIIEVCTGDLNTCQDGYTGITFCKQGNIDDGECEQLLVIPKGGGKPVPATCPLVCATNNKPVCCKENCKC